MMKTTRLTNSLRLTDRILKKVGHGSWRWVGLLAAAALFILFVRSSSAEFEVPLVSTNNGLQAVEFRAIWSFNRGNKQSDVNAYEAYAVGIDPRKGDADCPARADSSHHAEDCNGVFYYYNGTVWRRVPDAFKVRKWCSVNNSKICTNNTAACVGADGTCVATPFTDNLYSLNAVVGQENSGEGQANPLYVAGADEKVSWLGYYYSTPGGTFGSSEVKFEDAKVTDTVHTDRKRDFYALGAGQAYKGTLLAGGQAGLVASSTGYSDTWTVFKPTVANDGNRNIDNENVTSIRYANLTTLYVLTSTFPIETSTASPDYNFPKPPYKRDCSGTQTSRLYKVSSGDISVWTLLATKTAACAYDISIGTRSTDPGTLGPLRNILWIATSNGVYKYDEAVGGSSFGTAMELGTGSTAGKAYYAVTAIRDRGGQGVSLLSNGNFENHTTSTVSSSSRPDGWLYYDNPYSAAHEALADGTSPTGLRCKTSTKDYQMADVDGNGKYSAIVVWPSPGYPSAVKRCTNNVNQTCNQNSECSSNSCIFICRTQDFDPYYTEGVAQSVDLTMFEGQQFRITGRVKVEFNTDPGLGYPTPPAPQGGVAIGCAGTVNNTTAYGDAGFTNCSLSNRKYITVDDGTHLGTNGWRTIDITLSREDLIFKNNIYQSQARTSTPRRLVLDIRCEATYGAKVTCDNLKVEELSTPPVDPRDTFTIIAAGQNIVTNGIAVNEDGLNSNTFTFEALPNKVRTDALATPLPILNDINALSSVGLQHVFAAGRGYIDASTLTGVALFGRTPSTLTGTIWAGASSPTGATTASPIGQISVSCVDDRDASNQTLCQRSPQSYGLSLNITSPPTTVKTGTLTGRAWFGKNPGDTSDQESLDLGSCLNPPTAQYYNTSPNHPYFLGYVPGSKATSPSTFPLDVCDYHPPRYFFSGGTWVQDPYSTAVGSRRCWADKAHTTLTTKSCLTNFDCYGRCQKDEGFLCVTDSDCRVDEKTSAGTIGLSTGALGTLPGNRLSCGTTVNGVAASPLACSPLGWLTFNSSDVTESAPDGSTAGVQYNTLTPTHNSFYQLLNRGAHELTGWGRFMTMATQGRGWVHMRGGAVTPVPATIGGLPSLLACRDCDGGATDAKVCAFCQDAQNHSCIPSNTGAIARCFYECDGDTSGIGGQPTHCSTNAECVGKGTGVCKAPGFCTGDLTLRCSDNTICSAAGKGTCSIGAVCSTTGSQCAAYGVNLDTETGKFAGTAWSEDFGWLDFQNVSYGGSRIIQTKLGDIYATGQIGESGLAQPLDASQCNATYLITSGQSITGFCSALGTTITGFGSPLQQNAPTIPIISLENTYQNVLGRLDLKGLETVTDAAAQKNKFGSVVVPLATADITAELSTHLTTKQGTLGGRVFTRNGNTTISTTQFKNTPVNTLATNGPGSGLLIVNGDLTISGPLTYETGAGVTIRDLRQLASLLVVVRGNLTINNDVQEIVGAYYVTGSITTTNAEANNQYALVVNGLMIAKQFNLKRQFAGTIEAPAPSELIIYDGRLQSNPLPGVVDFANSLPNTAKSGP